jgi:hypothetical protein
MQTKTAYRNSFIYGSYKQEPYSTVIWAIDLFQVVLAFVSVVWMLNTSVSWAGELLSAIFCAGFPLLLLTKGLLAFISYRNWQQHAASFRRPDLMTALFAAELLLASIAVLAVIVLLIVQSV